MIKVWRFVTNHRINNTYTPTKKHRNPLKRWIKITQSRIYIHNQVKKNQNGIKMRILTKWLSESEKFLFYFSPHVMKMIKFPLESSDFFSKSIQLYQIFVVKWNKWLVIRILDATILCFRTLFSKRMIIYSLLHSIDPIYLSVYSLRKTKIVSL